MKKKRTSSGGGSDGDGVLLRLLFYALARFFFASFKYMYVQIYTYILVVVQFCTFLSVYSGFLKKRAKSHHKKKVFLFFKFVFVLDFSTYIKQVGVLKSVKVGA